MPVLLNHFLNEKENYNKLYYIFRNTLKNIYPNLYGFIRDRILGYNFTIRKDEFSNYRQVEINKEAVLEEYSKGLDISSQSITLSSSRSWN